MAVSPDSMTQSAPSRTALATSEASARVGLGLVTIDSSIWVAQITPFAALLHLAMIWKGAKIWNELAQELVKLC